jgi:flavin-binding protein dodecin
MIHSLYKVVSLLGESEELAPTADEAALQHVRAGRPLTRTTVTVHREGVTLAFRVEPTLDYRAFSLPVPGCFEARQ